MTETTPQPVLWYFADPMCSWCWGFSPVIEAIRNEYADRLQVALMLGGLRPGVAEPMAPSLRAEILHHWREVQARTGQPFRFEAALPEGFVYDTEPASRAVIAVAELAPSATFAYLKAVQSAFYADGRDVTQTGVLCDLAAALDVNPQDFARRFESESLRLKTRAHFETARKWGVRGFPTTLLQLGQSGHWLARGYRSHAELVTALDRWVAASGET
ncbi:MAG: DsbA family protein [Thiotrichales bacterium]